MADARTTRTARIERGIAIGLNQDSPVVKYALAALADLRAWQEIAERHQSCRRPPAFPCRDYQAADAAIDRLDALWGMVARPVTCDDCPATSESGWGDTPLCLGCQRKADPLFVCEEHQRTFDGDTCPLEHEEVVHKFNAYTFLGRRGECAVTAEFLASVHDWAAVTCKECLALKPE